MSTATTAYDQARASEILNSSNDPEVPEPGPSIVQLPGGWVDGLGFLHKTAEVREMTGVDEEAMSRAGKMPDGTQDSRRVMASVYERCTVKVGTVEADPHILRSQHLGDREAILLGIYIATYGNEYEARILCPNCGKWSEVAYELDKDLTSRKLEDPEVVWRDIPLGKNGKFGSASVRLITVGDQETVLEMEQDSATGAEMNTRLMAECVRSVNGRPLLGLHGAQSLNSAIRRDILRYWAKTTPSSGIAEVKTPCPKCQVEATIALNLAAIFLEV
jgi:hypothetical protein